MKKINILAILGLSVFVLSGGSAYAHGTDAGEMSGSMGMMNMMKLMHDQIDGNQAFNCDGASDMEMMEEGEEMMEEMMGHEDHEKMEASLNDEDHDSMHMMMGMWSSGCVGEQTANTISARYGADVNGMMGPGSWGYGMGGFGLVTTFLVWAVLIMAAVGLWRWIKSSKPGNPSV